MARKRLRNEGGVPYLTLSGIFIVAEKKKPDGDTVAFAATRRYSAGPVRTDVPVSRKGTKSVNLRLQSIDAPEKTQPMGAHARDALLEHLGFDVAALGLSDDDFTADGPTTRFSGWIATHGMDGNHRPLSYLFAKNPGFKHGKLISASELLAALRQSENYRLVAIGAAFPAFYENTDESHAAIFRDAADAARRRGRGVWKTDRTTTGFQPLKTALGPGGALVYPKFYRRVQEYKGARASASGFINWLKRRPDGRKMVQGAAPQEMPLWKLFERVSATRVAVPYDVTKLWFSE